MIVAMPINIGVKTADILTNIEGLLMQSQGVYMDFQIRLFRKLWISDTELASEYSIKTTFNQLSASFAAGNMFINSDLAPENRTRLVKLVALFASMKQKSGNTETFKLNACIPSFLMNLYPPAEWVNQIAPHIEQYAKLQEKDAQTQFIKDVKLCGNYGFSGFLLGHTTDQRMPPGCSLAVGAKVVIIIEPAKRVGFVMTR
jgi:hypothetical protein